MLVIRLQNKRNRGGGLADVSAVTVRAVSTITSLRSHPDLSIQVTVSAGRLMPKQRQEIKLLEVDLVYNFGNNLVGRREF